MSKRTKLIILIGVILLAGIVTAIFYAHRYYNYIYSPNVELGIKETDYIYIPTDSDYDDVLAILMENKILLNNESFDFVAEKKNYPSRIMPGRYKIENGMSNNELVDLLRSGHQTPVNLTFISLRTKEIFAARVADFIEADSSDLISLLKDPEILEKYGFNEYTIKSMFIPNTYQFYWNTSAEKFLERMSREYKNFWTEERLKKAGQIGLSPVEVSILASIIEAETQKNDEKARMAGVYINRLKRGWKLQADPTVVFALGDFTIRRVLFEHLKIDSPYNTYKYEGLPPGPINIPSIASIDAVLNYEKHSYMYFCASENFTGYHNFAVTLREHNANAARYHQALRAAGTNRTVIMPE